MLSWSVSRTSESVALLFPPLRYKIALVKGEDWCNVRNRGTNKPLAKSNWKSLLRHARLLRAGRWNLKYRGMPLCNLHAVFNFFTFFFQDATYAGGKNIFYTYMCTGRRAAASEHRTRNIAITSPMLYRYTNFACRF